LSPKKINLTPYLDLPDIFMPLLGGVLIDNFPGATGYRYFFFSTAGLCGIGLVASLTIYFKIVRKTSV